MNTDLVKALSVKAHVEPEKAHAVLTALLDLVRDGAVSEDILLDPDGTHVNGAVHLHTIDIPKAAPADPKTVDALIARAQNHRLGIEFLLDGHLGSVAAEFGAHAFTVEAARNRLRGSHA